MRKFANNHSFMIIACLCWLFVNVSELSLGYLSSTFSYSLAVVSIIVALVAIAAIRFRPKHSQVINAFCCTFLHTTWAVSHNRSLNNLQSCQDPRMICENPTIGFAIGMLSLAMASRGGTAFTKILLTVLNASINVMLVGASENSIFYSVIVLPAVWCMLITDGKQSNEIYWINNVLNSYRYPIICIAIENHGENQQLSIAASNLKAKQQFNLVGESSLSLSLWKNSKSSEEFTRICSLIKIDRMESRSKLADAAESFKRRRIQSSVKHSNIMGDSSVLFNGLYKFEDTYEFDQNKDPEISVQKVQHTMPLPQPLLQSEIPKTLGDYLEAKLRDFAVDSQIVKKNSYKVETGSGRRTAQLSKGRDETEVKKQDLQNDKVHHNYNNPGWQKMTSKGMQQSRTSQKYNTTSLGESSRVQQNMKFSQNQQDEQPIQETVSCWLTEEKGKESEKKVFDLKIDWVKTADQSYCAFLAFEEYDFSKDQVLFDRQQSHLKQRQIKVIKTMNLEEESHSDQKQYSEKKSKKTTDQDDVEYNWHLDPPQQKQQLQHYEEEDEENSVSACTSSAWRLGAAAKLTTLASSAKQKSVFYEEFCKQGLMRSFKCLGSIVLELKQLVARTQIITESDLTRFVSTANSSFHSALEPLGSKAVPLSLQPPSGHEKGVYCVPKRALENILQSAIYASTVTGNFLNYFPLLNAVSGQEFEEEDYEDLKVFSIVKMIRDIQHIFKKTISRKNLSVLIYQHQDHPIAIATAASAASNPHLLHPSSSPMQININSSSLVNLSISHIPLSQMANQLSALQAITPAASGVYRSDQIVNNQSMVRHLLFNLFHNAIEHTKERGRIAIQISRDEQQSQAVKVRIRNEYTAPPELPLVPGSLDWKSMLDQFQSTGNFYLGTRMAGKLSELVGPYQSLKFTDLYGLEIQAEVLISDQSQRQQSSTHQVNANNENVSHFITPPFAEPSVDHHPLNHHSNTSILGVGEPISTSQTGLVARQASLKTSRVRLDSCESFDKWIKIQNLESQQTQNTLKIRSHLNQKE